MTLATEARAFSTAFGNLSAKAKIAEQREASGITEPKNLEEQAISLVGTDIYEKLIKGYTQKQWGRPCNELPAFIIKRLPVRFTYDNNYLQGELLSLNGESSVPEIASVVGDAIVGIGGVMYNGESIGSGVCVSSSGHILTNSHVIAGTMSINLYLSDGRVEGAKVVYDNPVLDLAILKSSISMPLFKSLPLRKSPPIRTRSGCCALVRRMILSNLLKSPLFKCISDKKTTLTPSSLGSFISYFVTFSELGSINNAVNSTYTATVINTIICFVIK